MNFRFVGALAALAAAGPAAAQQADDGDPLAGLELAEQLCTSCHIVGTESVGSDLAPPFPTIATDPEMTLTDLHAWVEPGHPVMPELALGSQQIADINAYLDSLRAAIADQEAAEEEDPTRPEGASPRIETEEPPPEILEAPPEEMGPPITPPAE